MKFCYKMAKNDGSMTFCANTVQENEKMLQKSCCKNQVDVKSKEDFEKLFSKLNYVCQMKSTKEETQLNSSWCNKNVINHTYGPISGFPSGSWWGIRMDCSRDRVHDPFDENIQNGPFGVTSICTSSINLNEDVDFGNSLTVTGEKYVDGKLDKDPLIKNYESHIPVRLIRSYNLFNEFAPKTGYRYDGLYIVTNFWIGINTDSVKHYKFALSRLNDQEPPFWSVKSAPLGRSNLTSTLHCTSIPVRNNLKNSAPNMYEFKKYSHGSESTVQKGKHENSNGFPQFQPVENKKINEKEKGTSESAIVTRHVFKKVNANTECTSNVPNMSIMSENRSLTHIGNQGSKTHNTNISVRTGLYNSSHNTQYDSKKNTSSPFCRTAKSLNVLKSNQHIENWNLSNKDKNRNLDGKTQTIASNDCPKRVNYASFNTVKLEPVKIKFTKNTNAETNANSHDTSSNSCYRLECNVTHKEITNDSKDTCNSGVNTSDTTTNMLKITNCMYKNEISAHKMVLNNEQELKSLDSLDSLTPDKILHFINNKDHPLSKVLMGNMIGLTSEQSIALQTRDAKSLAEESKVKDKIMTGKNSIEEIKAKTNVGVVSDDLSGSRCYKFRRRRKLTRKIMNKSEIIKYNKIHNEKLKHGSLEYPRKDIQKADICKDVRNKSIKQSHVQKRESNCLRDSARSIKKNVANKRERRVHLQTVREMNSSIKKHMNKKKRREITNLLIDAKIGPKIRGPRYRRLRCINNAYAKQSYKHFDTTMCTLNKCKISSERSAFKNRNKLTKIISCKLVKSKKSRNVNNRSEQLNLKHKKISRNVAVSKKIDNHRVAKYILNNNNNNNNNKNKNNSSNDSDNNKNDNNKKSKCMENSVKIVENEDPTIIKNRKRKLIQTVYRDPKCSKIEKELHKGYGKEVSKPCKTDAVTQCSLIKEPLTRNLKSNNSVQNNVRNEQHIFIKIEYGDFKDMKSEVCEVAKSNDENKSHSTSRSDEKYMSCTDDAPYNNTEHPNNSPERVSAFVPVNIPDNDIKIARLRSIGFKPINFNNSDEDVNNQDKGNKVLKQNIAEKYNKYTNEENDIVVYMDDELQYQDIENEDKNYLSSKRKIADSTTYAVKNERLNKIILEKKSYNPLLEQELESPWHGWKKIVTNKDTYWIGW